MFTSVSRCAEPISEPYQLKVTDQGHGFDPWILCPLHISYTPGRIFFKLWSYVCLSEMICRTHNSTMPAQGQGHSSRSQVWALNFMSALYLLYQWKDFLWTLVKCSPWWDDIQNNNSRSHFKVMGLSHEFHVRSVTPLLLGRFSLNFAQMFTCGMMCRTHNSAMGTQGQGHSSRSQVWALNFVSTRYLLYPLKDFLLNFGQMFASVKWCAEPIAQPCRLTRSQFKVRGLSLESRIFSNLWSNVHLRDNVQNP